MKRLIVAVGFVLAFDCSHAVAKAWNPSPGHKQISIWPGAIPDAQPVPAPETAQTSKGTIAGKTMVKVVNVTRPTMTVYSPKGRNTGVAVVVFPGGGFEILAMDLEGTEVCDWLTAKGITCILLKYRVPSPPYDWHCDCRPHDFMVPRLALDDAQRTMGLVRLHAKQWHIDKHKIGVLGFSAGGFLVAEISTHFKRRLYAPVDAADSESARPDFAIGIYPGHLATHDDKLNPNVPMSPDIPPTFLLQAWDDPVDEICNSTVYVRALDDAGVPAEVHLFTKGGHAFGLRRTEHPVAMWPSLVANWLKEIGVL